MALELRLREKRQCTVESSKDKRAMTEKKKVKEKRKR